MNESKYNPKPLTLYVTRITETDNRHFGVDVEMAIDIQLTEIDARKLVDVLSGRLAVEVYGTIGIRLQGRLIL